MIILRLLLLLTNLHLKLLSTQGTGADKLLSTQRVKVSTFEALAHKIIFFEKKFTSLSKMEFSIEYSCHTIINIKHE